MKLTIKTYAALLMTVPSIAAQVAVYWGQNSFGGEQLLALYCESLEVDVVLMSFMNGYPDLSINLGGQCNEKFDSGLLHCSKIGDDIKSCQANGKKILMSLGGAIGQYGFQSDSQGEDFAEILWNKFGGGHDNERPFDDAVVDGFDFDIENKNQVGYVALAKKLRNYFDGDSRQYYLSAAPQCVYPDESVGDLMLQVSLDYAFVQFYNNPCAVDKDFNWKTWSNWAAKSPNPNVKLYLGLPGAPSSAGSGYIDSMTVCKTIDQIKSSPNFGGVMFWDASSSFGNGDMVSVVKNHMNEAGPSIPDSPTSSTHKLLTSESSLPAPNSWPSSLTTDHGQSEYGSFVSTTLLWAYASSVETAAVSLTVEPNLEALNVPIESKLVDADLNILGDQKGLQVDAESFESTLTQIIYGTVLEVVPLGYDNSNEVTAKLSTETVSATLNVIENEFQPEVTASVKNSHHHHKKLAFTTVTAYTTIYV